MRNGVAPVNKERQISLQALIVLVQIRLELSL